jgi:hypothetical protein
MRHLMIRVSTSPRLRMGLSVLCALLLVALAAPALASGQNGPRRDGEASGTIVFTDEAGQPVREIRLRYAYASSPTSITLSDRPLPQDAWLRDLYVEVLARDGKLNALSLMTMPSPGDAPGDETAARSALYCADCGCADDLGFWHRISGYALLETETSGARLLTGRARAPRASEYCNEEKTVYFELDVTFKASLPPGRFGYEPAAIEDRPGAAYRRFHDAVTAGDAAAVARLVASEHAASFQGPVAAKNVARLKSLIQSFGHVYMTRFLTDDGVAMLDLQQIAPGIALREKQVYRAVVDPNAERQAPPPPPPPPPSAPPAKSKEQKEVAVGAPAPVWARALMRLENGEWKVDWWLSNDPYKINLISNVATYRTYEEAEREAEEAYWRFESSAPVPAGGEAAGSAYLAYCRAEHAGDKKAMLEYLTGAQHELYAHPSLTIERGATIWKGGSALDFEKIEVLGGETDGEWARLDVRALRKGKAVTGKVMMVLDEGAWKVDREKWE